MFVGIFGGTFDPVHRGHMHVATTVQATLGVEEIRWLLAARPGHREQPLASIEHRWQMLQLVCAMEPSFVADNTEVQDANTSYTYNTLVTLRQAYPHKLPCWILGLDAYATLNAWYRWEQILDHCNLVVVERPEDNSTLPSAVVALEENFGAKELVANKIGQIVRLGLPMLPVSATEIRHRCGRGEAVDHLLAPAVNSYINQHQLYAEVTA